jgi:hypothetical protein
MPDVELSKDDPQFAGERSTSSVARQVVYASKLKRLEYKTKKGVKLNVKPRYFYLNSPFWEIKAFH